MSDFISEKLSTRNNLELIIDASPAGTLLVDHRGRILMVNQQVVDWFGYSREELRGQPVELLMPEHHRAAHVSLRHSYARSPVVRPMNVGQELQARRKDASEFPVDISLHPLELEDHQWVILAYLVDATERRTREQLQRLALLGQMAASVAHEIRNPLGVIRNSAYYLRLIGNQLDEEGHACLEDIEREVEAANQIVRELLDFARDAPPVRQHATLTILVDQGLSYVPIPPTVRVDRQVEELRLFVDPRQIQLIVANLAQNAVQAMSGTGVLTLRTVQTAEGPALEVSDSGPGISPAHLPRIFEPLFTTRAKGVGLGLPISRRSAELNHARLEVESRPGQGASFRLTFSPKAWTSPEQSDSDPGP